MHTEAPPAPAPTTTWSLPTARPIAARVEHAVKTYGRGTTEVLALDDVTVGIPAGAFTAVMGPSGSGKSTLMHCLAGLDTLTSGSVHIGDVDLAKLSDRRLTKLRRERIGFVFQAFNLLPTLTRGREHHAADGPRRPQAGPGVAAHRHRHGRARRPPAPPPERAVGRPAAARRRRPGAGRDGRR